MPPSRGGRPATAGSATRRPRGPGSARWSMRWLPAACVVTASPCSRSLPPPTGLPAPGCGWSFTRPAHGTCHAGPRLREPGGTLNVGGLLFVNRATWAHRLDAVATVVGLDRADLAHARGDRRRAGSSRRPRGDHHLISPGAPPAVGPRAPTPDRSDR